MRPTHADVLGTGHDRPLLMVALDPGISGLAVGAISGIASAFGAQSANEAAERSVQKQIDFQRESRQHSYQWAMDDMRNAGLNPILAYKQGGAGGAGGASFTPQNVLGAGVSSAQAGIQAGLNIKKVKAEIKNLNQNTAGRLEETYKTALEARNQIRIGEITEANVVSAKAQAESDKTKEEFYKTEVGKIMRRADLIGRSLNPFASATSSAASATRRGR